ncbi:MAG: SDR family NAD(P)-dependent oxidoreductase, partial [Saprospiraceae bacterium]
MYQENLFKNKHVLVTGGRSGIGYGIAKQYLQLGASVTIASRK